MEEYIDIFDDAGKPTGEKKLKSLVHKNGDRHKVAHIWMINSQGELLIQRRSPRKENHPNLWDISYAGHISAGENSIEASVREGKEELGLIVKKEKLRYLFTIDHPRLLLNNKTYIDHEFQDVYLLKVDNNLPPFILQPEEVAETKWVPWKELETAIEKDPETFAPHEEEYKRLFALLRNEIG